MKQKVINLNISKINRYNCCLTCKWWMVREKLFKIIIAKWHNHLQSLYPHGTGQYLFLHIIEIANWFSLPNRKRKAFFFHRLKECLQLSIMDKSYNKCSHIYTLYWHLLKASTHRFIYNWIWTGFTCRLFFADEDVISGIWHVHITHYYSFTSNFTTNYRSILKCKATTWNRNDPPIWSVTLPCILHGHWVRR